MQISPSYVKQAYSLGWRFFTQNKMASFLAMGAIFGLYLLSIIPLLGLLASVAAGIFTLGLQTYLAKTLIESESDEEYNERIQAATTKEMLTKYVGIAGGGFLGFIVIEIIVMIVMFTVFAMTVGLEAISMMGDENMDPQQQLDILQSVGIAGVVFLVIVMFLGYIYPIVLGRVYTSNDFGEAFSAMFTMFSPDVWKASFNGQYFLMVTMLHLTAVGMVILLFASVMTIVLIPVGLFLVYLFMLYAASTAVLAREIVFEDDYEQSDEALGE